MPSSGSNENECVVRIKKAESADNGLLFETLVLEVGRDLNIPSTAKDRPSWTPHRIKYRNLPNVIP